MNTILPDRASYTLSEMQTYWQVANEEIRQWLFQGILTTHVWLPVMSVFKIEASQDGNRLKFAKTLCHWEGHAVVSRHSCYRLFRHEHIHMREFTCSKTMEYYCLPDTAGDLIVTRDDLLILRAERVRFEAAHDIANDGNHSIETLSPTPSFKDVQLDGHSYRFGHIQSQVLQLLYVAAKNGQPWQSGKQLLVQAGSQDFSLSNLFKRKPVWRRIVISDGRGCYKMNEAFVEPVKTERS